MFKLQIPGTNTTERSMGGQFYEWYECFNDKFVDPKTYFPGKILIVFFQIYL